MSDAEKYRKYGERIKLFKGLTPDQVAYVLKMGQKLEFREGKAIFHEGLLGSNLFIVLSGEVAILKRNEIIAKCQVGDAFGEMAVLNHTPRTATALALTDVKVLTLEERDINRVLEKEVAVRLLLNIIHVLSERLENSNAYSAELRKRLKSSGAGAGA